MDQNSILSIYGILTGIAISVAVFSGYTKTLREGEKLF